MAMNGSETKLQAANRRIYWTQRLQRDLRESGLPVLECLECGGVFRSLSTHLRHKHKELTLRDYRIKHALPQGFKGTSPDMVEGSRERLLNDPRLMTIHETYRHSTQHAADVARRMADPIWREKNAEMHKVCPMTEQHNAALRKAGSDPRNWATRKLQQGIYNLEKGRALVKKCPQCGAEFKTSRTANQKYCSRKCFEPNRSERRRASHDVVESLKRRRAVCKGCGCDFVQNKYLNVYCTNQCYTQGRTYKRFLELCGDLQSQRPDEPIALTLPSEGIAANLSCSIEAVRRFCRRAVNEGKLVLVTRHVAHRTTASYRVVSA